MNPSRRDLLGAIATTASVAVGGCASSEESATRTTERRITTELDSPGTTDSTRPESTPTTGSTASETTAEPTGTEEPTTTAVAPTDLRQVSVAEVAPPPEGSALSFEVETLAATVSTASTAVVRVTVTNEADESRRVGSGHRPIFSAVYSEEQSPGLALLEPGQFHERPDYERVSRDCWRPDATITIDGVLSFVEIAPSESETLDLHVWDSPLNEGECLPTGTYRFRERYEVSSPREPGSLTTTTWDGFALRVEPA